mmetsp:Transcript_10065/g.24771  ORF Transcript_10065/g.24771 Transcript_10065/m.24771 type:complete len:215 (-) Transcript_10065:2415-3059(-)
MSGIPTGFHARECRERRVRARLGRVVTAEATVRIHSRENIPHALALPGTMLQSRETFAGVQFAAGARSCGQRRRRRVGAKAPVVLELEHVVVGECSWNGVDRLRATDGTARAIVALDGCVVHALVVAHDCAGPRRARFEALEAKATRAPQHRFLRVEHCGHVGVSAAGDDALFEGATTPARHVVGGRVGVEVDVDVEARRRLAKARRKVKRLYI